MTVSWYNPRKAAQITAFFANKEGESIPVLKIAKLIYVADREHMRSYGHPLLDDCLVSMPHGPVNSITLNYIDGCAPDDAGWNEFVGARNGYSVGAVAQFSRDALDELSDAEIDTLQTVWNLLGGLNKWEIRDWTHKNCPEWEDPQGSAQPIPHERVLKYLGHEDIESLVDEIEDGRRVEGIFAALR